MSKLLLGFWVQEATIRQHDLNTKYVSHYVARY